MSLWDRFDLFKAADAAGLASPANASEAKALLTKMQKGYGKALSETFLKHYETGHPESVKSGVDNRYPTFDTPLPEAHLYSRMLEMHAMVLFRPDFSPASCSCFHDWHKDETGLDGVFLGEPRGFGHRTRDRLQPIALGGAYAPHRYRGAAGRQ